MFYRMKKYQKWKRAIAWMLAVAMIASNMSGLAFNTAYAAERGNQTGKASPSDGGRATPSEARKVIDITISPSTIEKVLKKDFDERPELNEELIPFKGEQKDLVLDKLYEILEDSTLISQKKNGKAMYMVVISEQSEEDLTGEAESLLIERLKVIGVNGYSDRECEFRLRITGEEIVISDAEIEEYVVVGENPKEDELTGVNRTEATGVHSQNQSRPLEEENLSGSEPAASVDGGKEDGTERDGASEIGSEFESENASESETALEDETALEGETTLEGETALEGEAASEDKSTDESESSPESGDVEKDITTPESEVVSESETISERENVPEHEKESEAVQEESPEENEIEGEQDKVEENKDETLSFSIPEKRTAAFEEHKPAVLTSSAVISTKSEAEINPEDYDAPEIIDLGVTKVLSEDEKQALMGKEDGEEKKGFLSNVLSSGSQPFFGMVAGRYGIAACDMEVNGVKTENPYEFALSEYYGENANMPRGIAEITLSQNRVGEIKAGTKFNYELTYTMKSAPLYEYSAGGKLALFDKYENAEIEFRVPAGIVIEEQERITLIAEENDEKVYGIRVGDNGVIKPGATDTIVMNAYIDGNGKRAVGENFALDENCLAIHADMQILDKTDKENPVAQGDVISKTDYAVQPVDTGLTLISEDEWFVEKEVYPSAGKYTIISENGKPQYVEIQYLVKMGMHGASGEISADIGGTVYQTYGRTGFEPESYRITDSLTVKTAHAPEEMKPVSVEVSWGNSEDTSPIAYSKLDNGDIQITSYKTKGGSGAGKVTVDDSAPVYSSYLVTARYPYEPFVLNYNDPRRDEADVFTINNNAHLEYMKLGTTERVERDDDVDVVVKKVNDPAVITIKKVIDEGNGSTKTYNVAMEKEYPGYAGFSIYTRGDNDELVPYENYTVVNGNVEILNGRIVINPGKEQDEEDLYTTGNNGSIQIKTDPGTYIVKEDRVPVGTEYGSASMEGNPADSSEEIVVTVEAGDRKNIVVTNVVVGKGAVEFYKKARTWDSKGNVKEGALEGAQFGLYSITDKQQPVKTATSEKGTGRVLFKPVTPGSYVVKELSANGYILDNTEYPVEVKAGETAYLNQDTGKNSVINNLNKAKVQITKFLLNDDGEYQKIPDTYIGDFKNCFWIEKYDGESRTWKKTGGNLSPDQDSSMIVTLPVEEENKAVTYRIAEHLPEGYFNSVENREGDGFSLSEDGRYLYRTFVLKPLETTQIEIKNDRQGTLKLFKTSMSMNESKLTEVKTADQQFVLYQTERNGKEYTEVKPGTVYKTDKDGSITVKGLDITKDYYWKEVNHAAGDRLEAEADGETIEAVIDGENVVLIGPYHVSRVSDTTIQAYNVPQKVPYWIYKKDITNSNEKLSADFTLAKKGEENPVFTGAITNDGKFFLLEANSEYVLTETEAPDNYVKADPVTFQTPKGPITRKVLQSWFGDRKNGRTITVDNKPYKNIKIKKTLYTSDGKVQNSNVATEFGVYTRSESDFELVKTVKANAANETLAPGTYYFKEVVPSGVINPYFLLDEEGKKQGTHSDYIIEGNDIYFGPFVIEAATSSKEKTEEIYLGGGKSPLKNYPDNGQVKVTKKDGLRGTGLQGAVLGIYKASDFVKENWGESIKKPIQRVTTNKNGAATFNNKNLKIYDENGSKIEYVIAEITPPAGYLQTYDILKTTLVEGRVITTVNGVTGSEASDLKLANEPKLTIRTQKYWIDEWNNKFHEVKHPLGNVRLALYRINSENPDEAVYVATETTSTYDGTATFRDINRNDTYYVVEVEVPARKESGLGFDLNMGDKKPLDLTNGEVPAALSVSELENGVYNSVKYTGKNLAANVSSLVQNTEPLYNFKSWVQFNILKVCDGGKDGEPQHESEPVNGAKFSLYKQLEAGGKDLSGITVEDLDRDPERFEKAGVYESGTRIDPISGERVNGEFDTAILEPGKVYWLVEDEAAPGYELTGRKITAVFVPEAGYSYGDDSGVDVKVYQNGRNEKIATIENKHGSGQGGLDAYHFQIELNKWLKDESDPFKQPTLLGGAKFKIWLIDPDTNNQLLEVDVVETGLESYGEYNTGYALSKIINLGTLSRRLEEEMGLNQTQIDSIFKIDGNMRAAVFALEEIYAPSKVVMDQTLHYLTVKIPENQDHIDETYVWHDGKAEVYRLLNKVSKEYPVKLVKYGYEPDESTFGLTDDKLEEKEIRRTALPGVTFTLESYQWNSKTSKYEYLPVEGTYVTGSDGSVQIKDGLPAGKYRLKEAMTTEQQEEYITKYTGNSKENLWRYFTVGTAPVTVNVYNPEKPDLEIEKTTWQGKSIEGLAGISFKMTGPKDYSEEKTVSYHNGSYTALFENLEFGTYSITSESIPSKSTVTGQYFNTQPVYMGYMPYSDGNEGVVLVPASGATGKLQKVTIKNPQLSDLVITKEDAETKEKLQGASFTFQYMKFRTEDDFENGFLKADIGSTNDQNPSPEEITGDTGMLTDNGDGTYSLSGCVPGWYKITEKEAPDGYTKTDEPVVIAVVGDMKSTGYVETTKEVLKNRKKVSLSVTKELDFGDGFRLDEGIASKLPKKIVFDIFTWTEADGYKNVEDESGKNLQIEIENFKALDGYYSAAGSILLPQNPAGGSYYLKEVADKDWTTPGNGAITGGILQEDGYIKVENAFNQSQSGVSVKVRNLYNYSKIRIEKVDQDDPEHRLSGAEFELYSDDEFKTKVGEFKETGTSGIYEIIIPVSQYEPGNYFIKETKAPAGYIGQTDVTPVAGIRVKAGETAEITVKNKGGVDLELVKYSVDGSMKETEDGVTFELYRKSADGAWTYVEEGTTKDGGKLSFRGKELPEGVSYAVYEVPQLEDGRETSRVASFVGKDGRIDPTPVSVTRNGKTEEIKLYVLTGNETKAPGVYEFTVENQEAKNLRIIKNDIKKSDNPSGNVGVKVKITDPVTQQQIGEFITVPYGENGVTVKLLPGIYEIEEMEILDNSDGYIINRDDTRTVYKKTVEIKAGENPEPCEFTNVKQKTGVTLDKTSESRKLKDLWWNDGQTVQYTLTPHVTNTIPLDKFEVTDQGIQMLDRGKNVLEEAEYSDEKYTITSVRPGRAIYENLIQNAQTGTIMADITFYGFGGEKVGETQSIAVSGDGEIGSVSPQGGRNVKSFTISYHDDTLKNTSANHYVLGQNFVTEGIGVEAKLYQQNAAAADGSFKEEIKYVRNKASVSMDYREWDRMGQLSEQSMEAPAETVCDIEVIQSEAPTIEVKKNVSPTGAVSAGSELIYTLSVANITESADPSIAPFQNPILVDILPMGVTVSGEKNREELLKAVRLTSAPDGISIEKTTRMVDKDTGRETIFIQLKGNLPRSESVSIELAAKVESSIINYGQNILNRLYVTSAVTQPPFSLNRRGASFKITGSSGPAWPSADLPEEAILPEEKLRSYGYASDSAENYTNSGTGLRLHKEVKGNLDSRYVSGSTVGKVAKSASDTDVEETYDGNVHYRLVVNNVTAGDYVTQLQIMDILPTVGDYSAGEIDRLSDFQLKYGEIEKIEIENPVSSGAGRKLSGFKYDLSHSKQPFTSASGNAGAAKQALLNDNSSGFWENGADENSTAIRIKITDDEFYLAPGENLVVTYKAIVAADTYKELEEISYSYAVNDFTTAHSYRSGSLENSEVKYSQALTSNTVQVLLVPGNVKVSGRIWIDDNDNGIQDESIPKDHLLTDLKPVLESGYFSTHLVYKDKSGEEKAGTIGMADARFVYDELMPAKPFGITGFDFTEAEEDGWYSGASLKPSVLKGEDPAHYQIYVSTGTMPEGYDDLILKLAKPEMKEDGTVNGKAGRSRLPDTLRQPDGKNAGESRDSNFKKAGDGSSVSEDFFLWSTGEYDTTKDIGFVPYRNVTIKKENRAGKPVSGTHFTVYGPFTDEELNALGNIADPAALNGVKTAEGETTINERNEAVWNVGELLYYRNYIVVEDDAPAGYEITKASSKDMKLMENYSVEGQRAWVLESKDKMTSNNPVPSTIVVTNDYITGSLEFDKVDGTSYNLLPGAGFRITRTGAVIEDAWTKFIEELKTDGSDRGITGVAAGKDELTGGDWVEFDLVTGHVSISGIPFGSYTLSETKAPEGYDITGKPQSMAFTIDSDGKQVTLTGTENNQIINTRTEYSLKIRKADNTGNDRVADVKFNIVGPGIYSDTSWNPFAKPRFQLNSGENVNDEKRTNENGEITWNLPHGDYKITESSNAGYEAVDPIYVRVAENGTISLLGADGRRELELVSGEQNQINVKIMNTVKTGSLKLEKLDGETQKAVTGARFELTGESVIGGAFEQYLQKITGSGVDEVTGVTDGRLGFRFRITGTAEDAKAVLTQIPYGTYTLKEIEAPEGYVFGAGTEWTEDFIIQDDHAEISFTGENGIVNTPHELNIEKRDRYTDSVLAEAVFMLATADGKYVKLDSSNSYDGLTDNQEEATEFVTGQDGRVTVKRLPAGSYWLKEVKAPANYGIAADQEITVLRSGNSEDVIVYDVRDKGKILLNKAAAHNRDMRLEGAVFEIYSDQSLSELADTVTTKADGTAESVMLPLGTYYVKEKTAPAGYEVSGSVYEVTLLNDRETVTAGIGEDTLILNNYGTGKLTFDKVDSLSKDVLKLAEFSLTRKNSDVGGAWEDFTEKLSGSTGENLSSMGISDVSVESNAIYFTASTGHVEISGIPYGAYTLREEKTPAGYMSLNRAKVDFKITGDLKEVQFTGDSAIENERAEYELRLRKEDNLGRSVSGIQFEIQGPGRYSNSLLGIDSFKNVQAGGTAVLTTGNDGIIQLGLKHGDYMIKEAESGRYDAIKPFYIRVDEEGKASVLKDESGAVKIADESLVTIVVTNQIGTGTLELEKVDSENPERRLAGAEFTLTNLSTEVTGAWEAYRDMAASNGASWTAADVSGNTIRFVLDGKGVITNLPYGAYRLTEAKAPEGYVLGETAWTRDFTIDHTGKMVSYTAPTLFHKTEGAIANDPSKVIVTKVNALYADTKLEGAEFIIKAADGTFVKLTGGSFDGYTTVENEAGRFTTDSEGHFTVKRLPTGTYTLIETKAPAGYYVNDSIPSFTMDGIHSWQITVQDRKITGSGGGGGGNGGRTPGNDTNHGPGVDTVTIIPDNVPLANIPTDTTSDNLIQIDDGNVPLAGLPKTGRTDVGSKMLLLTSGILMALYEALRYRSKKKSGD